MKWVNKLNEALALNPYTSRNRVTVEYNPIANGVIIDVCGKTSVISADNLTEYGLMMETMKTIDRLYNLWPLIGIWKYFCVPIERLKQNANGNVTVSLIQLMEWNFFKKSRIFIMEKIIIITYKRIYI